jgi:CobQ-like glutamine amidotransferase family enzyme
MGKYKLKINHLYSENLNIYGDLGNIIALKYRSEVRGIKVEVVHTELNDNFIEEADIYFIGGGQDNDQMQVFRHLIRHRDFIKKEVEIGKVFVLICGGYQLFGKYFLDAEGNLIDGLHVLDIETRAPGPEVKSRCIGNIIVEMSDDFVKYWNVDISFSRYIVGFENHGGQTKLCSTKMKPIGRVIVGFGNNYFDRLEGCYYKNIIGTYCHGPLLPKNPHLADAIISKALGISKIKHLSDDYEFKAHEYILNRYKIKTQTSRKGSI